MQLQKLLIDLAKPEMGTTYLQCTFAVLEDHKVGENNTELLDYGAHPVNPIQPDDDWPQNDAPWPTGTFNQERYCQSLDVSVTKA